jgi:hypothetical protein
MVIEEGMSQERFVRGIFKEPANEVSHPWKEWAQGHIETDEVAVLLERTCDWIGHAE